MYKRAAGIAAIVAAVVAAAVLTKQEKDNREYKDKYGEQ